MQGLRLLPYPSGEPTAAQTSEKWEKEVYVGNRGGTMQAHKKGDVCENTFQVVPKPMRYANILHAVSNETEVWDDFRPALRAESPAPERTRTHSTDGLERCPQDQALKVWFQLQKG